jgi:cold shock protein
VNKGTVKFFNGQKGYGFISPDGGYDVFVHVSALERAGIRTLVEGQKVTFDSEQDRRTGKLAVKSIPTSSVESLLHLPSIQKS